MVYSINQRRSNASPVLTKSHDHARREHVSSREILMILSPSDKVAWVITKLLWKEKPRWSDRLKILRIFLMTIVFQERYLFKEEKTKSNEAD